MPHARKPKKNKSSEADAPVKVAAASKTKEQQDPGKRPDVAKRNRDETIEREAETKRAKVSDVDERDEEELKMSTKAIASIKGERIQVQTKVLHDLNRPSVLLRLDASDFTGNFQRVWEEHIPGFTGLRGSKRERTEKEKQMEWRQRVSALKDKKPVEVVKKNGQTVSEKDRMFAIERYRALKAAKASKDEPSFIPA
jgi:hypothetical protein